MFIDNIPSGIDTDPDEKVIIPLASKWFMERNIILRVSLGNGRHKDSAGLATKTTNANTKCCF